MNHLIQALRAESMYKRDVDYAVIDGEVKIIDEFTGASSTADAGLKACTRR